MPKLRARAAHPGVDLSTDDDAAAHARAERDEHDVAPPGGGPGDDLGQRGAVGVVSEVRGQTEVLREHPADGDVFPSEVIRPRHNARLRVAGTGRADADGRAVSRRQPGAAERLLHGGAHIRDDSLRRALCPGGDAAAGDDLVPLIHGPDGDIRPAEVNSDPNHG